MASTDTYNTLMSRFKKPNRQSMDRQQMQGQVYSTPGVTAPAKPALTAEDVEKEKNGTNGEVVQLGDAKPAAENAGATDVRATGSQYTDNTGKSDKTGIVDAAKPAMPGLKQEKIKGLEGVDTTPKSLKEWFSWYDEQRRRLGLETDADREKREKKEKAERIIAAIGDGVSALAQIHAAGNGAIVNQGTGTSLMEGVAKRHERLRQQRDANDTKLLSYLRERKNQELQEKRLRQQQEYQQRRNDEIERTHKENEEIKRKQVEIRQQVADAQVNAAKARQSKDEAQAKYWDAYAEYRAQGMDDNHAKAMAQIAKTKAQTANVGTPTTTTSTRYDKDGNVAGRTVTTRKKGGGSGRSSGGRNGNSSNQQGGKKQTGLKGKWVE